MNQRISALRERLRQGELIVLDGATGSEIALRGVETRLPLWSASALLEAPAVVKAIHADYIGAGADIITTNTFRTNTRVMAEAGSTYDSKEMTLLACKLAHDARTESGRDVLIAGCIAPIEDCYEPELVPPDEELMAEHIELARFLAAGGVDFIFIETMNCLREARAALEAAKGSGLPCSISLICNEQGNLLSGEAIAAALKLVESYEPLFVCVNCRPPDQIAAGFAKLASLSKLPFGVYANGAGCPEACSGWEFSETGTAAENYLAFARTWHAAGASVIGGCCGTSPEYIGLLAELRDMSSKAANS